MASARSLKHLLLVHELAFILLIVLAGAAGAYGIQMWDRASHESQRISLLIQEIQQTRGDLYRQMKELFDGYFLADSTAQHEYITYTQIIHSHFDRLLGLASDQEEKKAVHALMQGYQVFVDETSHLLTDQAPLTPETINKKLNLNLESKIFQHYEAVSAHAEQLLTLKQRELEVRLSEAKHISVMVLSIPIALATLLLLFSRFFLQQAIMRPIAALLRATREISAGNLSHKAPEEGVSEIASLSVAINSMAQALHSSREALVRTEKQAAQGLLVPMLAHNIRNPLASIRATAQVADSIELDQEIREAFQNIIFAVDRLERWTGALLAYLHPLKPNLAPALFKKTLEGAISPLQQKLTEKKLTLNVPPLTGKETLITDQHLLEQTLYNLLLNAVDAAPANSEITLELEQMPNGVLLSIADRGAGMPFTPDPHAASPGPSTKRFGTGLGIPFAFKVCEALSIQIAFHKRVGGGTLITLLLPPMDLLVKSMQQISKT